MADGEETQTPTAEEVAHATQVSTAAGTAIAGAENPKEAKTKAKQAMRDADPQHKFSDADINELADQLVEKFREMGVFDAPPAAAPAAPAPDVAAEAAAEVAATAPPEKKTFAQRFAGEI
ncbi:MAG TPA: hypothetical protein VG371_14450 [Solirubrobacteraceae bacterium]|jgi:hypothetical protein|nr:hypothetical protein [Solirubrobacteraceae bacterium]